MVDLINYILISIISILTWLLLDTILAQTHRPLRLCGERAVIHHKAYAESVYFNSSTTTENGGIFTFRVEPLRFAPLKVAGLILDGFSKLL